MIATRVLAPATDANYEWVVSFRDDLMGFQKQLRVEAGIFEMAVERAIARMIAQGYSSERLSVIEVRRMREVRS